MKMMTNGLTPEARGALEKMEKKHGGLLPAAVVEEARDEASPLHQYFTWDKDEAHAELLIIQARTLIRSVKIEVTVHERVLSSPRYVKNPSQGQNQGYVSVLSIKKDGQRAIEVFRDEVRRSLSMLRRAEKVAVSLGLDGDLEDTIKRLEGILSVLEAPVEEAAE